MDFPFDKETTYLTNNEKKRLEKFLENKPFSGATYTNKKGESRKVLRIAYPTGCEIEHQTVYSTQVFRGRDVVFYHTPLATVSDKREAMVWYQKSEGNYGDVTGSAWLTWLGEDFGYEPKKQWEPPTQIKARLEGEMSRSIKEKEAKLSIEAKIKPKTAKNNFSITDDAQDD